MKVMQTDLKNRSVRYSQDPYSHHHHPAADLVVHDNHPLEGECGVVGAGASAVTGGASLPEEAQATLLHRNTG